MRRMVVMACLLGLGAAAHASELDDVKGWRATKSVVVATGAEFVQPHVADMESWAAWAAWGEGKIGCEGAAGAVGRACTWTGADGSTVKMVVTAVDGASVHYDYFYGADTVANKGILSWAAADGGTTVTWDTAGTAKSVPKELTKTAADVVGKDLDAGLAKLKTTAEGEAAAKHAADVAAAEKKAADLEAAAKLADDDVAKATAAWQTAKTTADSAAAAVVGAKAKEKPAVQKVADDATKAADTAKTAADAATAKATDAHKAAEAARAEVTAVAGTAK